MSEVDLYRGALPEEIPADVRADWLRIGRLARIISNSKLCPQEFKDDPEAVFGALWMAHTLGMAVNPFVLKKFHNFDGVEPAAQTRLGLMHANGHKTRWGRHDDTIAELFVIQAGQIEEERFAFTVEQAKTAHLLDEWVERWIGQEVWADSGKPKKGTGKYEKYVLGSTTDEYRPDWVQPLIDQGLVKRKTAWFDWREDMLMNRACSRGCKFATPEVELGIERALEMPLPPTAVAESPPAALTTTDTRQQVERGDSAAPEQLDLDPGRPFE